MSTASQVRGRYLYAIVDGGGEREALGFEGVDGAEVYSLGDGRVSAVVSDLPDRKVRPERRKLAAHHEVLKKLMAEGRHGPADGLRPDRRRPRGGPADPQAQLDWPSTSRSDASSGKVEMGLRVSWDVPNIFEYALKHPPRARRPPRPHIFRGGRDPSQDDKIEVGRTFDRLMTEDREAHADRVSRVLEAHCSEIRSNKIRNDREVLNLACLVDRDKMKDFEAGVIEAARSFDNHFAFDFNGPWPPHNFVEIDLRMS